MDVVDAQVHLNKLVPEWRTADATTVVLSAVEAMDSLGIAAVLIDEDTGHDRDGRLGPATLLANGSSRFVYPFSERAVELRPDRFAYLAKCDPLDPDLDDVIADIAARPRQLCLRVIPEPETGDLARFEAGGHDAVFRAVGRHDLPVFVWLPGRVRLLERYARDFPSVRFVIDHCGVALPRTGQPRLAGPQGLDDVLWMARYENVALKWCKAPRFSVEAYPFPDLMPHLCRVLDAFGRERVMWASDCTEVAGDHSWGEALGYVRDSPGLSADDKSWLLGRTARVLLRWPR
ncbi:MAG: amidohydrolase family protein [Chloroflexota bacterium]|nr:amidohydrolase family protein [Chloroflexota bacterium]